MFRDRIMPALPPRAIGAVSQQGSFEFVIRRMSRASTEPGNSKHILKRVFSEVHLLGKLAIVQALALAVIGLKTR